MPTTTNFGWTTPADTDLVKDGALAIRTLGNGIDTSLLDLKGGTTGQVLAKNSNTDLDFVWSTPAGDIEGVTAGVGISGGGTTGTVTITNTMATAIDAKGDLVVGTGADTFSRLAVGASNDMALLVDSSTSTGVKWASIGLGAWTSYTPTWTNITIGNGTNNFKYNQIGKSVWVMGELTFGSTTSITGGPVFTLPVTASSLLSADSQFASASFLDSGTENYLGIVRLTATTTGNVRAMNVGGTYARTVIVDGSTPFSWTTNDKICFSFWYEAA